MSSSAESISYTIPVAETSKQINKPLPMSPVWRVINFILGVFFLLAAAVNANDNDWYLWVPLYMLPCLLCVSVTVKPSTSEDPIWNKLLTLEFIICALYLVYEINMLFLALAGSFENPLAHEEGRETGGLIIIIAWAGMTKLSSSGKLSSNRVLMLSLVWITTTLAVVPLIVWSLCFISDWHKRLGHCNNMFVD